MIQLVQDFSLAEFWAQTNNLCCWGFKEITRGESGTGELIWAVKLVEIGPY